MLTLVYDSYDSPHSPMTKSAVLEIFARANRFISPDQVWVALQRRWDRRCVYSYLLRLKRQGLLETGANKGADICPTD